ILAIIANDLRNIDSDEASQIAKAIREQDTKLAIELWHTATGQYDTIMHGPIGFCDGLDEPPDVSDFLTT
ncbi:MAG: hypothetical protein MI757_09920, partial [Pirellulales bacterium]|nr:hypothetical protein [Pirellulales bacterium]